MKRLLAGAVLAGSLACSSGCVARGARIRTPRGPRPIEELGEGDEVLCVDPRSGALAPAVVSATRSVWRECIRIELGVTELVLTSDHPVYCPDSKQWAPAGDWVLKKRSRMLHVGSEGVAPIEVRATAVLAGVHEVFDLTVDHPLHNFVANDVLVHNKERIRTSCTGPGGEPVSEEAPCACDLGGTGVIQCLEDHSAVCIRCQQSPTGDGGTTDAGGPDAGTPDGGTPEAGGP